MSLGLETEYEPFYLTSGLYYFFSGMAKQKIPVLSSLFNNYSTVDMDIAIKYIKKAASSNCQEVRQEAQYFLMKINFDVFKNYTESSSYCNLLIARYPENLLFHQYMFKNFMAIGKLAEANAYIILMEKIAENNDHLSIDETEYYIKQVRLEFNEYEKVEKY